MRNLFTLQKYQIQRIRFYIFISINFIEKA